MRFPASHDVITDGQNNGIPCKYCGSKSGHYGRCFTLRSDAKPTTKILTDTLVDILLSPEDQERLHGLGVKW